MSEQKEEVTTQDANADRLAYHAPVLRDHGSVDELTKGGTTNINPADSATSYDDPTPSLS